MPMSAAETASGQGAGRKAVLPSGTGHSSAFSYSLGSPTSSLAGGLTARATSIHPISGLMFGHTGPPGSYIGWKSANSIMNSR